MTIPAAPLPKVKHLLEAFMAPPSTGESWIGDHSEYIALLYGRGRLALAAGVEAVRRAAGASAVTVWIPGYFCNEALDALRRLPASLKFYPVREDLTPDWDALADLATSSSGSQVFVLVHYFGFPNAVMTAETFCDRYGMVLLEDAAHMLLPPEGMGSGGLMIFSPRKLLPVSSGGVLVASQTLAPYLDSQSGNYIGVETLRWMSRRLTQRVLVGLRFPWHRLTNCREGWIESDVRGGAHFYSHEASCDSYSLRLLTVLAGECGEVVHRRRRNYVGLLSWVADLPQVRPLTPHLPEDVCPYAFPILVKRGCQELAVTLRASGVPASRWPDLPPEVLPLAAEHEVAIRTYQELLLLPIHQSLSREQIGAVGQRLRAALTASS